MKNINKYIQNCPSLMYLHSIFYVQNKYRETQTHVSTHVVPVLEAMNFVHLHLKTCIKNVKSTNSFVKRHPFWCKKKVKNMYFIHKHM